MPPQPTPPLLKYFKAQNAYTRTVLDALPGRAKLSARIGEQPRLFGAAIDNVGDTNPVRDEFAEGGPANIPEFGSRPGRI